MILALTLLATATTTAVDPALPEATRWVMGTYLRVVLVDPELDTSQRQQILDAVFAEAQRWDGLLSNYDPTSPLSRVNAAAGRWAQAPPPLLDYLARSMADTQRTDGAFDLTAGALLQDPDRSVGGQVLELDPAGGRARLTREDAALDPGGDGKGVALDAMATILRAHGVRNVLVDFGGSSWLGWGSPPGEPGWRIAITGWRGQEVGTVLLRDACLSTSVTHRWDAETGKPGSPHIVDPRRGELVQTWRSAAVISPSATDAEVFSTALVVEGALGLRWLDRFPGAEALVLQQCEPPTLSPGATAWFELE